MPVIVSNFAMFYSHTQARAKLPKKRRRIMPVEHLPRSLAVRSNAAANQLHAHHVAAAAAARGQPATLAPGNLSAAAGATHHHPSNLAYFSAAQQQQQAANSSSPASISGHAFGLQACSLGAAAATLVGAPSAAGAPQAQMLVPRGATLDHHARARINLSNKDLLPDCSVTTGAASASASASTSATAPAAAPAASAESHAPQSSPAVAPPADRKSASGTPTAMQAPEAGGEAERPQQPPSTPSKRRSTHRGGGGSKAAQQCCCSAQTCSGCLAEELCAQQQQQQQKHLDGSELPAANSACSASCQSRSCRRNNCCCPMSPSGDSASGVRRRKAAPLEDQPQQSELERRKERPRQRQRSVDDRKQLAECGFCSQSLDRKDSSDRSTVL